LQLNKIYSVEFYVSLGDTLYVASNNIGMYFSDTAITGPNGPPLSVVPQINNDPVANPLTDKIGWTKVSGTYTSNGTENYITIGNFLNDASTDTSHVNGGSYPASYYYIDDVSVICMDCDTGIGIQENNRAHLFNVYPSPAKDLLTIEFNLIESPRPSIEIINILGQTMKKIEKNPSSDNKIDIDISEFPNGIYLIQLIGENEVISKKFLKQ
jgi:hypothetical protein